MSHAWLITGPPGSGRSTLATAFAASLIAGPGDEQTMRQVLAGTHPDVTALRTEKVIISIAEARALVERSYFGPSSGRYRVIVVEDADRMTERTSNVLLKALEEPPEQTVWILCAPSEADLLPTIRSRVRSLRLREPDVASSPSSSCAARAPIRRSPSRPRVSRSGTSAWRSGLRPMNGRARREHTCAPCWEPRGVSDAVEVAGQIVQAATEDAKALTAERDDAERRALLHTVGIAEGRLPPPCARRSAPSRTSRSARQAQRARRPRPRAHRPAVAVPRRGDAAVRPRRRTHQPGARRRARAVAGRGRRSARWSCWTTSPRPGSRWSATSPRRSPSSLLVTVTSGRRP
jgi:DNA polymerase-3 subunit delta'